ncbi:unnamed protein product [Linum trigynum]|uniref:Reverse transcriptase zinc-binding domain-containing protein n=1 Tax=Linum trigynum TaxID=586398 RepID=A0AAV2DEP4_9ROSI
MIWRTEEEEQDDWPCRLSLMIWFIWKHRVEVTFKGKRMADSSLINYVTAKAVDWLRTWDRASLHLSNMEKPQREDCQIGWKALPGNWKKMNTDGAAQGGSGLATAGEVLRDRDGVWMC